MMTERAKAGGRTIQWVAAWLLLLAGLTGTCATYKNTYIIALEVLGMLGALIWPLTFLALSPRGSASPLLSVTNGPVSLEQLTGKELREALDKSGIER
jgi:hypothetical protein